MADVFENPIGLDGFEFLEFTAPKKGLLEPMFEAMGFTLVAKHKSKEVELWRQGDINLLSNYEKKLPRFLLCRRTRPFSVWHGLSR